ncbi:MAG TPA: hypothetical protein VGS61_00595, partial [Acidimicrobiales bacterium]|nr:hypothetical protein [Acidimicrobiales bacterium]
DYGWNSARASFAAVLGALLKDHTLLPRVTAQSARWWLDVELANPWESWLPGHGTSRHSHLVDQSAVHGSLAYLRAAGVAFVGIYSSVSMWDAIMGRERSSFSAVPDWIPGSASLAEAMRNCATASFTGGFVAMTQYPSGGYDGDFQCGLAAARVSASVTVPATASYHAQLGVAASVGPVTFAPSTGSPSIAVSPTGAVATGGALARGTYTATGTTRDTAGDSGTYTVVLLVGYLTQTDPTTETVTVPGSVGFSTQLGAGGGAAPIVFAQTSGQPELLVSATGLVTTSGPLVAGSYSASGATSDGDGDSGTFHFSLSVGQLVQLPPTSAIVTSDQSATFRDQLTVSANVGAVTFIQSSGQPVLLVSSTGLVTTSGSLGPGTYRATGTMRDPAGDVGSYAFSLKVTPSTTTTSTTIPATTTTTVP